MRFWILKQRGARLGASLSEIEDWIAIGERGEESWSWRGPSNPRDRVFEVPAGDLVIVWDTRERVIWEASVSLGRASFHTWTDVETGEEISGYGLEIVRVAAFPCYVSEADFDAIAGPTNDAGRRTEGRITLHRIPNAIGADFWSRIVAASAEYHLDEEETGS